MKTQTHVNRMAALTLLALMAAFSMLSSSAGTERDSETGLVIAPGFETVKLNCTVCHSAKIITQNRMDREGWQETIRWMQETQGLWQFDPETEKEILDYLSANYHPERIYRRPPLSVEWN